MSKELPVEPPEPLLLPSCCQRCRLHLRSARHMQIPMLDMTPHRIERIQCSGTLLVQLGDHGQVRLTWPYRVAVLRVGVS